LGTILKTANTFEEVNMSRSDIAASFQNEHEIASLLTRWGYARDCDDWDTLADCFHDDATIDVSWMSGLARDFVARSRAIAEARKPGTHIKHIFSEPWIKINGDHAFSRCHANLYIRTFVDTYEIDLQVWIRFFDLLEKRSGTWRILKRTSVYDKDRLDPVDPRGIPADFFADMDLSEFPASARFFCYWIKRSGLPSPASIVSVYSDAERALRDEGEAWLKKDDAHSH
jgi:hypothetical protein